MRNLVLIIVVLTFFSCNRRGQTLSTLSEVQDSLINEYTSSFPDTTQLSIALIYQDSVSYFGIIKCDDRLTRINNRNSVFEIGSITKVFTSTLLSELILDSIIELHSPIDNVLSYPLNTDQTITFKNLANHTSGFPRMPENYQPFVEKAPDYTGNIRILEDYLSKHLVLKSDPGVDFHYSNLAYATLGYLIEKVTKTDYEDLLQQLICKKYGLRSTTTKISVVKKQLVEGRDSSGQIIRNADVGVFKPSGGIMSNVVDLSKFIQANFKWDKILDYQRKETYRSGNFAMALGWHMTNVGGVECIWYKHNGGMDGYRSSCFMDVASKRAVIILSNLSAQHRENSKIEQLAYDLLKYEYINSDKTGNCATSFIEVAINHGWGAHIRDSLLQEKVVNSSIVGVWHQRNNDRLITRTFTKDYKVQTDFYGDREIDVWGYFELDNNKITFKDVGGAACNNIGAYKYEILQDTLRFYEVSDLCEGRKNGMLMDWIRMKKQ